jgi:hypothetical protein
MLITSEIGLLILGRRIMMIPVSVVFRAKAKVIGLRLAR